MPVNESTVSDNAKQPDEPIRRTPGTRAWPYKRTRLWWILGTLTYTVALSLRSIHILLGGHVTTAQKYFGSAPGVARFVEYVYALGFLCVLCLGWRKVVLSFRNGGDNAIMRSGWWFSNIIWAVVCGGLALLLAATLTIVLVPQFVQVSMTSRWIGAAILLGAWSLFAVCCQDALWLYQRDKNQAS